MNDERRKKHKTEKEPIRTCLGCRKAKQKKEMLRVVKTIDDRILIDKTRRINGRGAYICLTKMCIDKGLQKKSIDKALRTDISPGNLKELIKITYNIAGIIDDKC